MPWLHKHIGNPVLTWFLNFFFKAGVSGCSLRLQSFYKRGFGEDEAKRKWNGICIGNDYEGCLGWVEDKRGFGYSFSSAYQC